MHASVSANLFAADSLYVSLPASSDSRMDCLKRKQVDEVVASISFARGGGEQVVSKLFIFLPRRRGVARERVPGKEGEGKTVQREHRVSNGMHVRTKTTRLDHYLNILHK